MIRSNQKLLQETDNSNDNVIKKESEDQSTNRSNLDMVISYIKYKISQLRNSIKKLLFHNILCILRRIFSCNPFRNIFHFFYQFIYLRNAIENPPERNHDILNESTSSSYPNSVIDENEKSMNLESINYNNEFGRCNLNNSIRKIKRKRKTKYSKELLRELNLDSDENILSSNESGDNNTFMKSQTDYSATFSEEALHKIKEMEEEIAKLKSQMELVCHLKTSQLNSMMLHEINHNKKSLNYQKYNNILLEENNENDCEITNHTTPPAPPPLPRVSNNNTPTNLIQNVKSNTFISPKILRLNNESLLNELQNVTLRHVEPVEKSKSFNSFLEEALYKKFKNVKENYSTDSEYSLSDWSE